MIWEPPIAIHRYSLQHDNNKTDQTSILPEILLSEMQCYQTRLRPPAENLSISKQFFSWITDFFHKNKKIIYLIYTYATVSFCLLTDIIF